MHEPARRRLSEDVTPGALPGWLDGSAEAGVHPVRERCSRGCEGTQRGANHFGSCGGVYTGCREVSCSCGMTDATLTLTGVAQVCLVHGRGLPRIRLHDLRRTHATLLRGRVNPRDVRSALLIAG